MSLLFWMKVSGGLLTSVFIFVLEFSDGEAKLFHYLKIFLRILQFCQEFRRYEVSGGVPVGNLLCVAGWEE